MRNWWRLKIAGRMPAAVAATGTAASNSAADGVPTVDSIADTGGLSDQPVGAKDESDEQDDVGVGLRVVGVHVAGQELLRDGDSEGGSHRAADVVEPAEHHGGERRQQQGEAELGPDGEHGR